MPQFKIGETVRIRTTCDLRPYGIHNERQGTGALILLVDEGDEMDHLIRCSDGITLFIPGFCLESHIKTSAAPIRSHVV